jgi:predicted nucleic acid-binding protein
MSSLAVRRWVVNASPVILLARIGKIALLGDLASDLIIPSGVAREI